MNDKMKASNKNSLVKKANPKKMSKAKQTLADLKTATADIATNDVADPKPKPAAKTKPVARSKRSASVKQDRIAVVTGLRTPFAKQMTHFKSTNAIIMGQMVVSELLNRSEISPSLVDQVVFGQVLIHPEAPNIAREIILGTGMDVSTDAFSVSRACATSFQSVVSLTEAIHAGSVKIGIAGGADSSSVIPIGVSRRLAGLLLALSKAKSFGQKLKLLSQLRPKDLVPVPPSVKEYSTGLTMGQNAEQMARDHGISREEQDALAHRSHRLAAKAWQDGKLDDEVMTAYVEPYVDAFSQDNNVRFDSSLQSYAKLKPAFDKSHGTLTAANSTGLTDGASAVLMMKEKRAKEIGLEPLGFIKSYAFAATAVEKDLLMGPAYATPIALDRAGMTLKDLTLIDMHEAFAAQALCNINAFASKQFAKEKLNRSQAIGEINRECFNVLGGSLAYGHPFAATGTRMITQTLRELKRRGGGTGLTTACAAGGLGAAIILEVD